MKMRTSVQRCPARYPYLTPAPRAATVSPFGGSSSTLLFPIKSTVFKYPKEVKHPTQNLPVRTGACLFSYFKLWVIPSWVGGCFLPIHWHLEFIVCCAFLISVWCVNPLSSWSSSAGSSGCVFVCVQPSQPVSVNLPFTHAFRRLMLKELGVGGLLLTAVWRGVRWASEVFDKVGYKI